MYVFTHMFKLLFSSICIHFYDFMNWIILKLCVCVCCYSVQPDDVGAWINVGRTFKHLENYSAAEKAYQVAKSLLPPVIPGIKYEARVAPSHLSAYVNLANIIKMNNSRLYEADKVRYCPWFIQTGWLLYVVKRILDYSTITI